MEANLMTQAGATPVAPPANTTTRRQAADTVATPTPARTEAAQIRTGAPAPSSDIPVSVDILNVHSAISQTSAEELTFDIPIPFGESEVTESVISRYVDSVNQALYPSFFRLNVGVHEPTNRITVQVIDTNTDEVVREVPPESRLDVIAKMQEFVGLLFDGRG